jgi:hypothetical protein
MAAEDLLGAGLDIEGWSYLKGEVAQKISELTDRSLILRSTFPMVIKSKVSKDKLTLKYKNEGFSLQQDASYEVEFE